MTYIAKQAAGQFLSGGGPLSAILADAAKRHSLNAHQVQRTVELANHEVHAAFYKAASDRSSGDRNVEFEMARTEDVLAAMHRGEMPKTASAGSGDYSLAPDRSWKDSGRRGELTKTAAARLEASVDPGRSPASIAADVRKQQSEMLKQASLKKTADGLVAAKRLEAEVAFNCLVKEASNVIQARRATFDEWRTALLSARPTQEVARLTAKVASVLHQRGIIESDVLVKVAGDCDPALFDLDMPEGYKVNPEWCVLQMVDTLVNAVRDGESMSQDDVSRAGAHPFKMISNQLVTAS